MQKQRRRSQENWVPLAPPCNTPTAIFRKDFNIKKESHNTRGLAGVSNRHQTPAVLGPSNAHFFSYKRILPGDFESDKSAVGHQMIFFFKQFSSRSYMIQ